MSVPTPPLAPAEAAPRRGWHVLVIGMMGSGKTTVGRLLAARLGRPYLDSDLEVQRLTGRSVPEIFAEQGEAAFRAAESRVLADAVASPRPAVVSVAGGAVLSEANRELVAAAGQVVWLRARPETLAARVGAGDGRPLLEHDPAGTLRRLDAERRPLYERLAGLVVDVDGITPAEAVERVAEGLLRTVRVELGERSYDVVVGPGARSRLAATMPPGARLAAVVTERGIGAELDPGIPAVRFEVPDGEAAKTLGTVEQLCRGFARAGLTRGDVVVALGGGSVSDVAGLAAACWHRGTPLVNVATTLLAQVDAAIGGKTAVNLPEGKNLVGAFWQPRAVICDTDHLATLAREEWRSGLGEMAKYAFLGAEDLDRLPLAEQVAACVALKAAFVAGDERESGRRMLLNYGHTLAHALEAAGLADAAPPAAAPPAATPPDAAPPDGRAATMRHGEAVAVGLVFAARLARRLGRIDDERVARHLAVVDGYGLSAALPAGADPRRLVELMGRDKKVTGAGLTFVLDGPSGVEPVSGIEPGLVAELLGASELLGAAEPAAPR